MKSTKLWTIAAAAALLVACGGGGGDDAPASQEPPPPPVKAEGAYEGTMSSGYTFNALILENDEFWTLYGQSAGGTLYVLGMVQGSGSTSGNQFVSSNAKDFYYNGIVAPGSLSATFVPRTSFNGTASAGGQSVSFNAAGIPSADFNYDQPASLAAVAGSWSGATLEGGVGTLNISAAGAISGSISGCGVTGTLTPRASGKNVFNATITLAGSGCATQGLTGSGVAVSYKTRTGRTQLLIAGVNSARTQGTAFVSLR